MICYLEDVTQEEISVINDYWELSDDLSNKSFTVFRYTLDQIDDKHKSDKVRPVSVLAKKSVFFATYPVFICQDCSGKIPAKNRMGFINRIKSKGETICSDCLELKQQRILDDAHQTLNAFKADKFVPIAYLNNLTIDELLALLSITAEQAENNAFLGSSPDEVTITGVQLIDKKMVLSLIDKKALVYIPEIPIAVERAGNVLYGSFNHITYENRYKNPVQYRPSKFISSGVYVNSLTVDGGEEVSDISSILYQKLQSLILSVDDVAKVHQIIKETQLGKLYELVIEIGKEFKIPIDNSNVLRTLLDHLAEKHPPLKVHFTFRAMAKKTIEYMHTEAIYGYRVKHYFAKFVGNYIQYVESNGFELKKFQTLPSNIQTSPFEALFSQLYLDGHFDWNRLSTKEVLALWLENVRLAEDAEELLT